jgi:hypothetical protein
MSVFISYSRKDASFVNRLTDDLKRAKISVWLDVLEIEPGDRIIGSIETALESSEFFLLILSPASIESPWVRYEWSTWMHLQFAAEREAQYLSQGLRRTLIPICLDNVRIPTFLRDIESLSISSDDPAYQEGLKRILGVLGGRPKPLRPSPVSPLREDHSLEMKLASNLLRGLLDNQFDKLLHLFDPQKFVGPANPKADQGMERARQVVQLIELMSRKGPQFLIVLQESILSVHSPFSPFNGNSLENWMGYPSSSWQVANSQIVGMGNDPWTFSNPDTPVDLQCASLLAWEGLRFRDGRATVQIWIPLIGGSGAGGLILRKAKDLSAIFCLLRITSSGNPLSLELWRREGSGLRCLQSVPCSPDLLTEGWCRLTLQVNRNIASAHVASVAHLDRENASLMAKISPDQPPGNFGFVKFNSGSVIFAEIELCVHTRQS